MIGMEYSGLVYILSLVGDHDSLKQTSIENDWVVLQLLITTLNFMAVSGRKRKGTVGWPVIFHVFAHRPPSLAVFS